ncbi:DNA-binding transcriptional regulator, LysR family [Paenibacillus tianmuensis]|uniref:DNA-binding transcriptional regulator, LysR family n=1 Tax=Paenibacillus tianmuensis TaxID=624147 RepID=A0A1G4SHV1_9BACL|nr:LysR family transcriptional regulator [Paenibacillus tianmuensis]SCW68763.1 DNA-binding transcriptional regulator, LysR family [Paenibacillus tianmuensis]
MNINLNNLNVFLVVADKLNVTDASKTLFISQPAVSKSVKNLEKDLNVKLFIRDKHKGLILTDIGREIRNLAIQMKSLETRIFQLVSDEHMLLSGKIKLASFPAASAKLLPKAISSFRSHHPQVAFELDEGVSNQIKDWVRERKVEFGIVTSPFDGFEYHHLISDYMVAVLPESHKLIHDRIVPIENYQSDLIYCKGGHEDAIAKVLHENKITYSENLTVQTTETLVNMVNNHLGIGIISKFTLSSVNHQLIVKEIEPKITRNIGLIALSMEDVTPAAKEFIRIMREQAKMDNQ